MSEAQASIISVPVLWELEVSHYNEKVRWALDYKRVPHVRRSLLPGLHIVKAKRLTGDTSTTPVLTSRGGRSGTRRESSPRSRSAGHGRGYIRRTRRCAGARLSSKSSSTRS
jgi:Glutathione S-transferase, N-terminal domain